MIKTVTVTGSVWAQPSKQLKLPSAQLEPVRAGLSYMCQSMPIRLGTSRLGTAEDLQYAFYASSNRSNYIGIVDLPFAQWQLCLIYLQALLSSRCFALHDGGR